MKIVPLVIIFHFLCNGAICQLIKKTDINAHGGINISNITTRYNSTGINSSQTSIVGFAAGATAEIPAGKGFYLQPGASFSQLGAKVYHVPSVFYSQYLGGADSGEVTVKSVLNYVTLPVLIKYKLQGKGIGFGFFTGVQYGFLIRAADKVSNSSKSILVNSKNDYNTGDFAGLVGAEYYLPVGVGISARYQQGLSNIQKGAERIGTVRNKAFTIVLGYRL